MFFLRFYKLPVVLFLGLITINLVLNFFVNILAVDNEILLSIGTQVNRFRIFFQPIALIVILISYIFTTWKLFQWNKGKTEDCYYCGGIVDQKNGIYGFYYRCRICSKTRS